MRSPYTAGDDMPAVRISAAAAAAAFKKNRFI
jgi:hypothetical protein